MLEWNVHCNIEPTVRLTPITFSPLLFYPSSPAPPAPVFSPINFRNMSETSWTLSFPGCSLPAPSLVITKMSTPCNFFSARAEMNISDLKMTGEHQSRHIITSHLASRWPLIRMPLLDMRLLTDTQLVKIRTHFSCPALTCKDVRKWQWIYQSNIYLGCW